MTTVLVFSAFQPTQRVLPVAAARKRPPPATTSAAAGKGRLHVERNRAPSIGTSYVADSDDVDAFAVGAIPSTAPAPARVVLDADTAPLPMR